jgi:predicted dehydrogenase
MRLKVGIVGCGIGAAYIAAYGAPLFWDMLAVHD